MNLLNFGTVLTTINILCCHFANDDISWHEFGKFLVRRKANSFGNKGEYLCRVTYNIVAAECRA